VEGWLSSVDTGSFPPVAQLTAAARSD